MKPTSASLYGWLWNATRPVEQLVLEWTPRVLPRFGFDAWRRAQRVERWVGRRRVLLWKRAVRR